MMHTYIINKVVELKYSNIPYIYIIMFLINFILDILFNKYK